MNTITLMMAGLLCVMIVNGQNYEEAVDDYVEDEQHEVKKYRIRSGEQRSRRRKWRMGYGYDDQPYSHYLDRRNTYDRNEEVIPQIFKLLDDLSEYIKTNQKQSPPLPPQFIYVPYPVPYPVPQYINCNPKTEDAKTNVTRRPRHGFADKEGVNENLRFMNDNQNYKDNSNDDVRPKSFNLKQSNIVLFGQQDEDDDDERSWKKMTTRKTRAASVSAPIAATVSASESALLEPCNAPMPCRELV